MLPRAPSSADPLQGPRAALARVIPRRKRIGWLAVFGLSIGFAILVLPIATADRWFAAIGNAHVTAGERAPLTVRVPPFAGYETRSGHIGGGGGVVIARGELASRDDAVNVAEVDDATPHGAEPYLAYLLLAGVFAGLFAHHTRRSNRGRLVRVQLVSLALVIVAAIAVKLLMLATAVSVLVVPVAVFALVPTLVLDRVVGLATGTLAALVMAMLVPFDVGVAIILLVQIATAGLVVAERPKHRVRAVLVAGAAATVLTGLTYPMLQYLTTGHVPTAELHDPLRSAWVAAALGPAIATVVSILVLPIYQLLVGEITDGKLVELADLSNPLLKQIAERSPGTWQHSLMMANMAEIAANAIGANGRLVRVGAYYHDLGKSLQPKYFIENLEPGETSPHDKLPPEVSCEAIFKHVTEGIIAARRAGLHERIIDFMHMHHGNGVLEYFWAKCREQGNPGELTVEHFRYPGVPPQSRETAILAICDAVEAASRTIKKAEPSAIDNLVQRIVYGKLHLGQLDDSGLSMSDLRKISDSLRETIRHANHGRIEYPWQKAEQGASATPEPLTSTGPRLDSLDRPARADVVAPPAPKPAESDAFAQTDAAGATPKLRSPSAKSSEGPPIAARGRDSGDLALDITAAVAKEPVVPVIVDKIPMSKDGLAHVELTRPSDGTRPASRSAPPEPARSDPPTPPADEVRARPVKRTDDTGVRRRATGDFVAAMVIRDAAPMHLEDDAAPRDAASEKDTGKHRSATAAIDSSKEIAQFTAEAARALDSAAKDIDILPPADSPAAVRKRAATLPPTSLRRPPTMQPPIAGRRAPTMPPIVAEKPSSGAAFDLTDAATPKRKAAIIVEPEPDAGATQPRFSRAPSEQAAATQPNMPRAQTDEPQSRNDDTQPRVELPLPAPAMSDPHMPIQPPAPPTRSTWAKKLASRLDSDEEFGTDTPVSAPTKAELQALLDTPLDPTRQQTYEEIEKLHRQAQARRSEPELDFSRRPPHATAEVREEDIEAAIEVAPAARRTGAIGIAKKKPDS